MRWRQVVAGWSMDVGEEKRKLGLQFGAAVGLVLVPNQIEGKQAIGLLVLT